MNLLGAINQRISRRSYVNTPIEKSKLNIIQGLIDKYNQEGNLSMMLIEDGSSAFNGLFKSYGMFKGVRTIIAMKGRNEDINLKEKLGYYGELIVLAATSIELGTCWVGGTYDKNNKIFNVNDSEELICAITIGYTLNRTSFKENIIRNSSHRKIKALSDFFSTDSTPPQWFINGIQAVRRSPSALNRQAFKFEYKDEIVTAFTENTSKYDLVDLGIAKSHFALAAEGSFEFGNHGIFHRQTDEKNQIQKATNQ